MLARKLRYRFEDMDERIEERTGRTVARIFREDGEEAFRELEREEALALSSLPRRVVATGGGAFARPRPASSCSRERSRSGYGAISSGSWRESRPTAPAPWRRTVP